MKFGMRKPSLKKSIKARTTGKLKRKVKKAIIPGYGKKGMGWIKDPKKAAYNKVYNKTTFGVNDVIKAASSTKSKPRANPKSNQRYASNGNLWQGVKELQNELGINIKAKNKPAYYIYGGLLCIIIGSGMPLLLLIGFVLEILGVVSMRKKSYWDAYRWHKATEMYKRGNYAKSKAYLNKLSNLEKESDAYKKMMDLLSENNENFKVDKRTIENNASKDFLQKREQIDE